MSLDGKNAAGNRVTRPRVHKNACIITKEDNVIEKGINKENKLTVVMKKMQLDVKSALTPI